MKILTFIFCFFVCMFVQAADWQKQEFGADLVNRKGEKVAVSSLNDKIVGIYFSAHWCPPCRQFTPVLVKFRDELVKKNKKFEIVFVSFDRNAKAMSEYMTETQMGFLALPYENTTQRRALAEKYDVHGIPTLIILGKDGAIVTRDGREQVMEDGVSVFEKWMKK